MIVTRAAGPPLPTLLAQRISLRGAAGYRGDSTSLGALASSRRNLDCHGKTPAGSIGQRRRAAVGHRQPVDDRQAEADPAGVTSGKSSEGQLLLLSGHARAVV